ncbi:MAG: D-glycero-beta-D-manno-heptose 1-phosphate adenylyltransferase [Chitinophagaceae bacterium]|nr:D-glycero-beta-D-manno-heptose 1-phosphate adenylyltransferase [Chitinophagaceae bacterium]
MKSVQIIPGKIYTLPDLLLQIKRWRLTNKKIAFTNGVFDILHQGHVSSLSDAAGYADILIVGVNADASVKKLKGETRPVNNQQSRALILASMIMVDAVVIFNEDTPIHLITSILPDVLIKGGDYTIDEIVGAKEVIANGGQVKIAPIIEGFSTTNIIKRMRG